MLNVIIVVPREFKCSRLMSQWIIDPSSSVLCSLIREHCVYWDVPFLIMLTSKKQKKKRKGVKDRTMLKKVECEYVSLLAFS